jgi:hypothetical protein
MLVEYNLPCLIVSVHMHVCLNGINNKFANNKPSRSCKAQGKNERKKIKIRQAGKGLFILYLRTVAD